MAEALKIRIEVDGSQLSVFDQAGKKLAEVGIQAGKAGEGLQKVDSAAKGTSQSAGGLSSVFGKVGASIISLNQALDLTTKALALMRAGWDAATSGIARGGFFDDLAKKTGVAASELSAMSLTLATTGVSFETFGRSLNFMQRQLDALGSGSKEAVATFERIGLSAQDFVNKSPAEAFQLITTRLQQFGDSSAKTAVQTAILGRQSAELGPLLNESAESMARMRDLSERLGLTLTNETASALDAVGDNFAVLDQVSTGLAQQFAVGLEPGLRRTTDALVELAAELINGGQGARDFGAFIGDNMVEGVATAAEALAGFLQQIADVGIDKALNDLFAQAFANLATNAQAAGLNIGANLLDGIVSALASPKLATFFGPAGDILADITGLRGKVDELRAEAAGLTGNLVLLSNQASGVQVAAQSGATGLTNFAASMRGASLEAGGIIPELQGVAGFTGEIPLAMNGVATAAAGAGTGLRTVGAGASEAAGAVQKLQESLAKEIATLIQQNAATQASIDAFDAAIAAGLSVAEATQAAADAAEIHAAQLKGEATGSAELTARLIEETKVKQALRGVEEKRQAIAQSREEVANLQEQTALYQQVLAGVKSIEEAEHAIAVLKEEQNLSAKVGADEAHRLAEEAVTAREQFEKTKTAIDQMKEGFVDIGKSLEEGFTKSIDAFIAGTADLGDIWKGVTAQMGSDLLKNLLVGKKGFDGIWKVNLADLLGYSRGIFGEIADTFLGGSSGSGGSGNSLLQGIGKLIFGDEGFSGSSLLEGIGNLFFGGGSTGLGTGLSNAGWLQGGAGGFTPTGGPWTFTAAGPQQVNTGLFGNLGGASWSGALGGLAGGYFGAQIGQSLFGFDTGLTGRLAAAERDIQRNLSTANQLISTVIGGLMGGLFGGGGIGGGIIGGLIGIASSGFGQILASGIDRDALKNRHFSGFARDVGKLLPIPDITGDILFGLLGIPTLGTAYRQGIGHVLRDTQAFKPFFENDLWDRSRYRGSDFPGGQATLDANRSAIGGQGLRAVRGFGAVVGPAGVDLDKDLAKVAAQAFGLSNILTDMFSKLDLDSDEAGRTIIQTLGHAFMELGVTAPKAFEDISKQIVQFADTPWWESGVSGAQFIGDAILGTADIFENFVDDAGNKLPAGIHLAALALQGFEKDGVKAFNVVDQKGRDALVGITNDAEKFDQIVQGLIERGFVLNTDDFKDRFQDIVASAALIGDSLASALSQGATDGSVIVQAVMNDLGATIKQALGQQIMSQLFDKTAIATSFEPVFAVLRQLQEGEFDLTTATGADSFAASIVPAIAEGRANLEEYLPILREQIKIWKEIQDEIDEALEPSDFEKAAIKAAAAVDSVFGNLGGIISESIDAGIKAGARGEDASAAFASHFGEGVEKAITAALFNAFLDTAVLQPIIDKWAPAFQYVMTSVLSGAATPEQGIEAMRILRTGMEADAEAAGPLIMGLSIQPTVAEQFYTAIGARIEELEGQIRSSFGNAFKAGLDAALEAASEGASSSAAIAKGSQAFADAFAGDLEDAILTAISNAVIQGAVIQGMLAPLLAQLELVVGKAMEDGKIDASEMITIQGLAGQIIAAGGLAVEALRPLFESLGITWLDVKNVDEVSRRAQKIAEKTGAAPADVEALIRAAGTFDPEQLTEYFRLLEEADRPFREQAKRISAATGVSEDALFKLAKATAGMDPTQVTAYLGEVARQLDETTRQVMEAGNVDEATARKFAEATYGMDPKAVTAYFKWAEEHPEAFKEPAELQKDAALEVVDAMAVLGGASQFLVGDFGSLGGAAQDLADVLSGIKAPSSSGGGGSGTETVNFFARGGTAMRGSAVVGEAGMPELVTALAGGGFRVSPLGHAGAAALMGAGVAGFAGGGIVIGPKPPGTIGPGNWSHRGGSLNNPDDSGGGDEPDFADFTDAIVSAIRAAFDAGGDLVADFADTLGKDVHERLIAALIKGFSERGPMQLAARAMDALLTKAEGLARAFTKTPEGIAALNKGMAEVQAGIAAQIEKMREQAELLEPILDQLRLAGITVDVSADLGSTIADVITGALSGNKNIETAVKQIFFQGTVQGVVEGLLITGPLADAIDGFSAEMGAALQDVLADGIITKEEAARLRGIGENWAATITPILKGAGEVFGGLFDDDALDELKHNVRIGASFFGKELGREIRGAWRSVKPEDVAATIPTVHQVLDQPISDAIKNAIMHGGVLGVDEMGKAVNQALYDYALNALIDAFLQSAIFESALAPVFTALSGLFGGLMAAILAGATAEKDAIVGEIKGWIGVIGDIVNSPEFKEAIGYVVQFGTDLANTLGITLGGVTDRLDQSVETAKELTKDVCKGTCNLKQETVELGELQLDVGGRGGVATLERYVPRYPGGINGGGGPSLAEAQAAFDAWLATQGLTDSTGQGRNIARLRWQGMNPQYAGIPVLGMGADVMGPTLALIAERGPERVQPLGSAGGMVDSADVKALREENRELRREVQGLRKDLRAFMREVSSRPDKYQLHIDGRAAGEVVVAGTKRTRQARRSHLIEPRSTR